MTPIAAMVKELLEKGVGAEAIVIAIEGAERALAGVVSGGIPVDTAAEKRRAYDRARKRNVRGIPPESTGHPRNSETASLSKERKIEEIKEEGEAPKRNVRGHRLPDDWVPSAPDTAIADETIGADRRRAEIDKFRDHWKQQPGSKGVKLDWDAAWRNWIRRAAEYGGKNGHGSSNLRTNPAAQQSGSASVFAGVAAATERRARERSAAGQQREVPRDADPPARDDVDLFRKDGRAPAH